MTGEQALFFHCCLIILGIFLLLIFIRVVIGPRITDRIVGINMMGTVVMCIFGILALLKKESYLIDISIIYAIISFLSVVVLCKVFMGVYNQQHAKGGKKK